MVYLFYFLIVEVYVWKSGNLAGLAAQVVYIPKKDLSSGMALGKDEL